MKSFVMWLVGVNKFAKGEYIMKVNITGFMRNMLRPNCGEMVAEFLGNLKELRNDPSKHNEFFDLYVFSDDSEYRKLKECANLHPPTPQGQNGTAGKPQVGECTTSAIA